MKNIMRKPIGWNFNFKKIFLGLSICYNTLLLQFILFFFLLSINLLLITKLRIKHKIKYNNNKSIFYKEKMPKTKLE